MIQYKNITDSTQNDAKKYILDNNILTENSFFIAQSQTNGYGRNSNKWISDKGNFYGSIIINNNKLNHGKILPLICAISVDNVLNLNNNIQYKWPNDLLINGSKIAGILIEKIQEYTIIGIGINLVAAPKIDNYKTANLKDLGLLNFDVNDNNIIDLAIKIADKIIEFNHLSQKEIIDLWLKKAFGLNEKIQDGIFVGLNSDGEMLIKNHNTIVNIINPL